jgi:transcriptional regulator with XRE-family HTH domain
MGCALFKWPTGSGGTGESFEGYNVTVGRQARGLSLSDLAERIGIAVERLADIEQGREIPDGQEMFALSRALDFPLLFFWRKKPTGFSVGFVCARGARIQTCSCGFVAKYLCDFPMGKGKTCDALLCEDHAVKQGTAVQDLHYCPQHALIAQGMVDR